MDALFKALNDPARRALLDSLRARDGQTLTDLETPLAMTRFGVMKHLRVLEEAHLVTTRKLGRFKYHYLNPLPLQEALDRWIEPFRAKPAARAALTLKQHLEATAMTDKPDFIHQTIIRCTPDALWNALIDGEMTRQFYFGTTVSGLAEPGETLTWTNSDGSTALTAKVIAAEPGRRLDMTFVPHFIPGHPQSRQVFVIDPMPGACKLTIEHYDLPEAMQGIRDGWVLIASGLKTLLETGEPLVIAMPA